MKPSKLYYNRHVGKRCVLVCNGPSLNKMDLGFLKHEIVIGLNKIYLGLRRFGFYPRYYVAVNKKVIEQSANEIADLASVKFISDRGKHLIVDDPLTNIIRTKDYARDFSFDIGDGVQEGYTVTYAALQIAFYLGFSKVVIIGMDHRFSYEGKPNEEKLHVGDDMNHFTTGYFKGHKWDNPDLVNSERYYKIAKTVFEQNGREIIDATVDGACPIFKKMNYEQLFKS
ncbi:DUF115 domain-containing protein [Alteromonas sp. Cnat3-28]|uniref:6-hydroxymethylpterin diphosphokinase MptE-like protein n=1 Tax=Alteromonas sp. Cnat3-28 TaxID=2917729 RepID=UPI001EF5841C|nr:6-hydroxymethylpterin diphosphokinase MptE-like protein [Alteromonas sp. Cnat3-28]MCG7647564.1 DUF115 domain-containing protein [Alteromonas sp. Cnat3-28]